MNCSQCGKFKEHGDQLILIDLVGRVFYFCNGDCLHANCGRNAEVTRTLAELQEAIRKPE